MCVFVLVGGGDNYESFVLYLIRVFYFANERFSDFTN